MYLAIPNFSEIHQLSKNRGSETIHEGFRPDREIFGAMAFEKGSSQMDPALVESQGPL